MQDFVVRLGRVCRYNFAACKNFCSNCYLLKIPLRNLLEVKYHNEKVCFCLICRIKELTNPGTLSQLCKNPILPYSSPGHWFATLPGMAIDKFLLTCGTQYVVYTCSIICEVCELLCVRTISCIPPCFWPLLCNLVTLFYTTDSCALSIRVCVCVRWTESMEGDSMRVGESWRCWLASVLTPTLSVGSALRSYALRRRNVLALL